jgi:uncharacterized membrane protein YhaH (DUF805 family)
MHWFIDPIKYHYSDFTGRTGREAFWMFTLFSLIINIVLEVINNFPLIMVVSLALLAPSLSISARRLHDIGKSGWWQLLTFIPIIGWIILIVWYAQKTDPADNIYGAPAVPKSQTPPAAAGSPVPPASDTTTPE